MRSVSIDNGLLQSPCKSCRRRRRSKRLRKCKTCELPGKYDDILQSSYGIWSGEDMTEYQPLNFLDVHMILTPSC